MEKINYRLIMAILGIILLLLMTWYFSDIVVYIIIAAVLSLIAHPFTEFLNNIKIGKFKVPSWLSSMVTIMVIFLLITGFLMFFVPFLSRQAEMGASIDIEEVSEYFDAEINEARLALVKMEVISKDERLIDKLGEQVKSWLNMASFSNLFSNLASTTGSLFYAVFSVFFLTFFFLKDPQLLKNFLLLLVPDRWVDKAETVLHKTKVLLSRYFVGLMSELIIMMTVLSLVLSILGVKNALLIGFLGGLMNIIPYIGPLIGAGIGIILGIITSLSLGNYDEIWIVAIEIAGTFAIANLIDNIILQPVIYSKSVSAHPIEIFLVIIMAGSLAGIPGMILAIPTYTVIRIVARESLSGFKLVDKLTENI